ncbi:MAG: hypothetical protein ACLR6J_19860 [Parabacteroides merdae]
MFDTKDDPLTADNDFLPSGNRHWTSGRFYHKLQQLAKVITAAGEWSTPALIGLCGSRKRFRPCPASEPHPTPPATLPLLHDTRTRHARD